MHQTPVSKVLAAGAARSGARYECFPQSSRCCQQSSRVLGESAIKRSDDDELPNLYVTVVETKDVRGGQLQLLNTDGGKMVSMNLTKAVY